MTKYLFAASTGGHLAQLVRLSQRLDVSEDSLWVTFRSPQSESLLSGRRVLYIPYIRPRDVKGVVRGTRLVRKAVKAEKFEQAISTGAGIALAVFPVTRMRGIANTYIESVSRVDGPSLTGRIVHRTRLASTWTQHAGWATSRWRLHGSVMSGFERIERASSPSEPPRIFVTLGTIEGYRFDSVIDHLVKIGAASDETEWQLGVTDRSDLPGKQSTLMSNDDFERRALEADVVVTHAGVGTILKLLDLGIYPVIVPRRSARKEHVDDHQEQIAALVARENLGLVREVGEIDMESLLEARRYGVQAVGLTNA